MIGFWTFVRILFVFIFLLEIVLLLLDFFNMSIVQQIAEIEEEMARTQKNKATEKHIGLLKAK